MTDMLSIKQFAALLRVMPAVLQRELDALPAELTRFRPAPGEWSINEVIGHIIEAEQHGFAGRIQQILAEEQHICQTWDPNQVAEARGDTDKAVAELWQTFAALREKSVTLVLTLQPEQLARSGQHPSVGELSIRDLLYEWVYHDRNHFKQIESNIQAWFWPQLGNAQRFYQG